MILTDREIEAAISASQVVVIPVPSADAYSSTSLDLKLASMLRIWKTPSSKGVEQLVSPSSPGYKFTEFVKEFTDLQNMGSGGFVMEPGSFILAWTSEVVKLPSQSRLAARVEGKSSLARLGIGIHITAPTIHAGFEGPIQLELCNHGPMRVKLMTGMPVCQLIFEQTLGTPQKGYKGQFFQQKSI